MSTTLTRRQRAIYEFIVDCVRSHGIPPSLTEIADAFELASASGVADHLRAIERKGYIRRRPGVSRGIELVDAARRKPGQHAVQVPVIGSLPAVGRLSARHDSRRHLLFDGRVARRGAIAVRVDLAGLERHGILPGDYLIVVQGARPASGEMALAHLGRTTALVEMLPGRRRVRRLGEGSELAGAFELLGRVVAVLREMNGATRKARG
jgi:repressor LexA